MQYGTAANNFFLLFLSIDYKKVNNCDYPKRGHGGQFFSEKKQYK